MCSILINKTPSRPPSMHVDDFVTMGNNRVSVIMCMYMCLTPSLLRLLVVYRKVGCTLQGGVSWGHTGMGGPYMMPTPHHFMSQFGGRSWIGGVSPSMSHYSRRDMPGTVYT